MCQRISWETLMLVTSCLMSNVIIKYYIILTAIFTNNFSGDTSVAFSQT